MSAIGAEVFGKAKLERTAKGLQNVRNKIMDRLMVTANKFANSALANIKSNYLTGPRPRRLGTVTGNLRSKIRFVTRRDKDDIKIRFGTDVKYAAIHERGGVTHPKVTKKMRAWAWARFRETGASVFRGIALTSKPSLTIKIRPRPFLEPGIKDKLKDFRTNVRATLIKTAREGLAGV